MRGYPTPEGPAATVPVTGAGVPVLDLTDPRARDPAVSGAKAANLARAAAAGLPVLPGFVLPVGLDPREGGDALAAAWRSLGGPERSLVVRSSSVIEDLADRSMAGQFTSVVGVEGWDAFLEAAGRVRRSGGDPGTMAVLVQPRLHAACGGVLFGMDPVSGNRRRLLVEAIPDAPRRLVDGSVTGSRYVLSRTGRVQDAEELSGPPLVDARRGRRLARLARDARRLFGSPQDVEWAEDGEERLWLLQSRPITAAAAPRSTVGPVLGPGPVAETFPHQVRPLERELWVAPMRAGIVEALAVAGAAPRRRVLDSPVLAVVDGWVAVDLELLGYAAPKRPLWQHLDPSGPLRHLLASWRVGRLRVALPEVVHELVDETDVALHGIPALRSLADGELVQVLYRARRGLVALHAHEVLAGMLLDDRETGPTATGLALRALAAGRARGTDDATVVAGEPAVLCLTAPRIGPPQPLPDPGPSTGGRGLRGPELLPPREALRLRIRWVQELGARTVAELARRWSDRLSPDDVALLSLAELEVLAAGGPPPAGTADRRPASDTPPLPASFRLTTTGDIAAATTGDDGRGAGGGRAIGTVRHLEEAAELLPGDVLVVRNLSPELAGHLEGLGALVSETGSVLSHLAILAREVHVPTVVGVADACRRFTPGTTVLVDGTAGTVERLGGRP